MDNEKKLPQYVIRPTTDHDKKVKLDDHIILCYSQEQLNQLFPEGNYTVIGETTRSKKAERTADLLANNRTFPLSAHNSHSRLLYSVSGYAKVGDGQFVALLRSRLPFFGMLFGGMLILALLIFLFMWQLKPKPLVIIDPDHPLPTVDGNADKLPDDPNSQRPDVPEGGGSLSMIYTLEAKLTLSTGEITMYFQNPAASSHDVSIILYIVTGDQEIAIAQSGLLQAGFGLNVMEFTEGTAQLQEGVYNGKYLLSCFDPATGERALVQPEITGVTITVVP